METVDVFFNNKLSTYVIVEFDKVTAEEKCRVIEETKKRAKTNGLKSIIYLDMNNIGEEIPV